MKTLMRFFTNKRQALLLTAMACILSASALNAQTMTMAPHKWVLNAQGNATDIQAIFSGPMPAGAVIYDYNVVLQVNNVNVAPAISFVYCYVDNNYIASFEKSNVFQNAYIASLAGTPGITAQLIGTYSLLLSDGSIQQITLPLLWDAIEIVKPGRKM